MNQSFYIGAVGAQMQQRRMNIIGDNIANLNTVGFKADRTDFTALMYQNHRGALNGEDNTQLPMGVGTRLLMTSTNFAQGPVEDNGRSLDYMIEGDGFFALVDLATGEVSYTRNGAFMMSQYQRGTGQVDENGQPVTETIFCLGDGEGRFVLSEAGGLIEVTDPTQKLPIGIFDYPNYNGMTQLDDTRYLPVDKNGGLWYGTGTLRQGVLEGSNADLAEEYTKVIESQRAYGMALKMVQTSDEIENTINNLRS
ncbi:MAG: flagellar hook-basal body protein [Clostridiales bacterium]|nr:flagellar hook-basal body protein [Clostridiales bacterium]